MASFCGRGGQCCSLKKRPAQPCPFKAESNTVNTHTLLSTTVWRTLQMPSSFQPGHRQLLLSTSESTRSHWRRATWSTRPDLKCACVWSVFKYIEISWLRSESSADSCVVGQAGFFMWATHFCGSSEKHKTHPKHTHLNSSPIWKSKKKVFLVFSNDKNSPKDRK